MMTSPFQDEILGHIAVADPLPAKATEVFFKVCTYEDASLLNYLHALVELRSQGLITFAGLDWTNWLCRLTGDGRRYVNELISEALLAMCTTGMVAQA